MPAGDCCDDVLVMMVDALTQRSGFASTGDEEDNANDALVLTKAEARLVAEAAIL